jgi:hypothetical protein
MDLDVVVSCDHKPISLAYGFQLIFEDDTGPFASEQRFSAITTEGEEVELPGMMETDETLRHRAKFTPTFAKSAKDGAPSLLGLKKMGHPARSLLSRGSLP